MNVGDRVVLTKDIWDDGADHHPPGYLARAGEVLVVREDNMTSICVSHEHRTDASFRIYEGEYERREVGPVEGGK